MEAPKKTLLTLLTELNAHIATEAELYVARMAFAKDQKDARTCAKFEMEATGDYCKAKTQSIMMLCQLGTACNVFAKAAKTDKETFDFTGFDGFSEAFAVLKKTYKGFYQDVPNRSGVNETLPKSVGETHFPRIAVVEELTMATVLRAKLEISISLNEQLRVGLDEAVAELAALKEEMRKEAGEVQQQPTKRARTSRGTTG